MIDYESFYQNLKSVISNKKLKLSSKSVLITFMRKIECWRAKQIVLKTQTIAK
jgi:hypothetical protein